MEKNTKPAIYHKSTWLQHGGSDKRIGTGVIGAMEQAVTFRTDRIEDIPVYARMGNTLNHAELHGLLAGLYDAEAAVSFGSGMAALSAVFLTYLKAGDHALVMANCYGTTQSFFKKMAKRLGIEFDFAPIDQWEKLRRPNTKLVHVESISNPFCIPQDVAGAVAFAKRHNMVSVCDNTFASPFNCQPHQLGCDIVVESGTKYLNGHSDVTCGVVAGQRKWIDPIGESAILLGGFLPVRELSLWLRGLRTFVLRMKQHNANGRAFASAMSERNYIECVWHGTQEKNIREQFLDGFGGMCALRFKPAAKLSERVKNLKYAHIAPSLGGTETTLCLPYYTTHYAMTHEEKSCLDVDVNLLRVSIGLECVEDLIADFDAVFK